MAVTEVTVMDLFMEAWDMLEDMAWEVTAEATDTAMVTDTAIWDTAPCTADTDTHHMDTMDDGLICINIYTNYKPFNGVYHNKPNN